MGNLLSPDEVFKSFMAVNSFLLAGRLSPIEHHNDLILQVNVNGRSYTDKFDIECKDRITNESYILDSNTFKSNGFYQRVWSAYQLFTYNDSTQELSFQLESKGYILRHW